MRVLGKWNGALLERLRVESANASDRNFVATLPGATEKLTLPPEPNTLASLIAYAHESAIEERLLGWLREHRRRAKFSLYLGQRADVELPETAVPWASQMYPYQRIGAAWLANARRGILGDDVGLGKTLQALTALRLAGAENVLIVTLNSAKRSVWEEHCATWLGQDVAVCSGPHDARAKLLKEHAPWVVINHEMLRPGLKFPGLWDRQWDAVVVDEAHKLQGRGTQSQQSLGAESLRTDLLFLLTGTPIWNKPESLWHLLRLLQPHRFSSYWRFVDEYFLAVNNTFSIDVIGVRPDRLEELQSVVAPLLLKRTKAAVLPQLPSLVRQTITYELEQPIRRIYTKIKNARQLQTPGGTKYYDSPGAALADMRRLLNDPKLVGLDAKSTKTDTLRDLIDGIPGKVVVFTWHRDYAAALERDLAQYGVLAITGETSDTQRDQRLRAFRIDDSVKVLVGNIGAIGTAINDLIVANVAIFAEGSHVPTLNAQAEGRLHRNGQQCDVTIYRLQARDTVESSLWTLTDQRADLSDSLLAFNALLERVFETD